MVDWKTLVIAIGSEWAPDGAVGREVLQVDAGGGFRYEHRHQGEVSATGGVLDATMLAALAADLKEAGFPVLPQQNIPPGSSLMEIRRSDDAGSQSVWLDYHAAMQLPGYRELCVRFESWTKALRAGGVTQLAGERTVLSSREP